MKKIFITGTDTGVGKTIVSGLLARYFLKKGHRVVTQKWVQTGNGRDIRMHMKIMGIKQMMPHPLCSLTVPYLFKHASAPHLAARLEGKHIDRYGIESSFTLLSKMFDVVIVEGSGGVLVPLDEHTLLIDSVKNLRIPVLVVAGNKLGCINHSLLTVESLNCRKIKVLGIVFNNMSKQGDADILGDNPRIVKGFVKDAVLGTLPFDRDIGRLYKYFIPIAERILSRL